MASHIVLVRAGITTFDWISVLNDFIPPLWVSLSFPEIDPVFFRLGPLQFRWYGLMYLLGLLAAYFLIKHRAAARNIPLGTTQMSDLIVYAAFGVFLGGRLGYTLFYNTGVLSAEPPENSGHMGRRDVLPRRVTRHVRRAFAVLL